MSYSIFDKPKATDNARIELKNKIPIFSRFKTSTVDFYEKYCPFSKTSRLQKGTE